MIIQNPDILIRPATIQDLADLCALSAQLGYPGSSADYARRLGNLLHRASHILLVAENSQGKIVGWIHGYIRRLLICDAHIEIGGLIIDEAYRSQGIGKNLVVACESWAHDKLIPSVIVRSNIRREGAHNFYQRNGYQTLKTSLTFKKELDP